MTPDLIVMMFSGPSGEVQEATQAAEIWGFSVESIDCVKNGEAHLELAEVCDERPVPDRWSEVVLIRAQRALEPHGFRLRSYGGPCDDGKR